MFESELTNLDENTFFELFRSIATVEDSSHLPQCDPTFLAKAEIAFGEFLILGE